MSRSNPRILHISSAKSWRGGEQQIAYLFLELQKKNIFQKILCTKGSAMENWCIQQAIPFIPYKKVFPLNPLVSLKIKNVCRQEAINLIHAHDAHAHTFSVLASVFGNHTPIILSRRVDFPIQTHFFSHWKYNHFSIKKIICVSHFIKKVMEKDVANIDKLEVVHSGIDIEKLSYENTNILHEEYGIPLDIPIVANIAAIAPHKDYFTFVNAVDKLVKMGAKAKYFIIGADGGEKTQIEDYIQQKKLEKEIILTGFREDIPKILPEITVILFTSKTEGLGTSLIDACACGVSIVATNAGGIPEIIKHQKTGLLASIGDDETLAKHVKQLLGDERIREKLILNARQKVLAFSKEQMATKTLGIYQQTIDAVD